MVSRLAAVFMVLGTVFFLTENISATLGTPEVDDLPFGTGKCWIFVHMNKSGGTSVKKLLSPWIQQQNNVSQGLFDSKEWASGAEYAQSYTGTGYTMTWGGYTEGLRPYAAENCMWFTVFRQ